MKCERCGKERGAARFCRWCGAEQKVYGSDAVSPEDAAEACALAEEESGNHVEGAVTKPQVALREELDVSKTEPTKLTEPVDDDPLSAAKRKKIIAINLGIAAVLVAFIIGAVSTMEVWEKVDDPGHEETFHSETYNTGLYIVTMDDKSPCYVGEDWVDCTNKFITEYNRECTKPLVGDATTSSFQDSAGSFHQVARMMKRGSLMSSRQLCNRYGKMISDMQSESGAGYVASLGDWGHLSSKPETKTRQVSNNDYVPPTTHEAYCFFGFLGECPEREEDGRTLPSASGSM